MKYVVDTDYEYNNPETEIKADQYILFKGKNIKKQYPETYRSVVFYDKGASRTFVFYINNS